MSDALGTVPPAVEPSSTTPVQDAASPSGGAAPVSTPEPEHEVAQGEVLEDKPPKTVECLDLTFVLPETLPGTVAFDLAEIEDGKKDTAPIMNLLKSIVGRDPWNLLYETVRERGLTIDETYEVIEKLAQDVMAAYSTTPGESQASAGS